MHRSRPWHGVMVATTLPFRDDLSVDHDAYADHVRSLIDAGCDGVVPNGSLGEYQTLTDEERSRVVETAVAAAGDGDAVVGDGPSAPMTMCPIS
ncbi:dihydrodipicolinate synthase family protein, partial [Streptomyces cavourensis]|nr:dihydrodipicolinate synthase family protein [Streptomyces cavourensis]